MSPHHDIFIDYVDLRQELRYVRLGDEDQHILIHG
jgi:hypothetical protein